MKGLKLFTFKLGVAAVLLTAGTKAAPMIEAKATETLLNAISVDVAQMEDKIYGETEEVEPGTLEYEALKQIDEMLGF